mgnify:CR=1 FL=1
MDLRKNHALFVYHNWASIVTDSNDDNSNGGNGVHVSLACVPIGTIISTYK